MSELSHVWRFVLGFRILDSLLAVEEEMRAGALHLDHGVETSKRDDGDSLGVIPVIDALSQFLTPFEV